MERDLLFYEKRDYNNYKISKEKLGYSLISITGLIYDNSLITNLNYVTIVDISSLSEFTSKQSIAEQIFPLFQDYVEFVCDFSKWKIMEYDLRYVFGSTENSEERIFKAINIDQTLIGTTLTTTSFKTLFFYEKEDYYDFEKAKLSQGYFLQSVTKFISEPSLISELTSSKGIIDISAITEYSKLQSIAEETLHKFADDLIFICENSKRASLEYELRFVFNKFSHLNEIFTDQSSETRQEGRNTLSLSRKHKKIIDLSDSELLTFFDDFRKKLYGHPKFKDDFEEQINTFRIFNGLGEHKILSFFLMGESGVGKTEVARLIFDCLKGKKRLAKINFGNYSNEFSLSSLIGSARGYIGSDDGEIFMKVRDTDIGILLIDEFEKSNTTLFNYFLEVLESGKMTNSLGAEIDLNGFIIIFTSNISKEDFKKKISPELRSRIDYKGRFTLLSNSDKLKYLEFRSNSLAHKLNLNSESSFSNILYDYLKSHVKVSKYSNMRDINKQIKKAFVAFIMQTENVSEDVVVTDSEED